MKSSKMFSVISILLIVSMVLVACGPATTVAPKPTSLPPTSLPTAAPPTATTAPATPTQAAATPTKVAEQPLYLAIIWHQHQPLYYKDPKTGVYARPWVRMHAVKDYYDMAATVAKYPRVHVTFNLTPTLIRQLDDLAKGAKDKYWVLAEKPADQLTEKDKTFILRHFFDANWDHVIGRFPQYKALLDKRGRDTTEATINKALKTFTTQDYRDLQVWFNLAWMDPDILAQEPFKSMTKKEHFTEADKAPIFAEHLKLIMAVIPEHRKLQDAGQIEVTMTPYTHPILPLLYDTNLAKIAMPDVKLPHRFSYPNDAIAQVRKGVQLYEAHFGRAPRGMWPAEGAVAQQIVKMVADAKIQWMASDEEVLAKSLGMGGFTRDSRDTVKEADKLYRPYYAVDQRTGEKVAVVFRDHLISDKVGFTYSGMSGESAAKDFIRRIHNIKAELKREGATGPHLVTVILDGENAWEYYRNDGKAFLNDLYKYLSDDPQIKTITPSAYLKMFPQQPTLQNLWAGSWINHDFSTWIGEPEENEAWNRLGDARKVLSYYDMLHRKQAPKDVVAKAEDLIYTAEGSDWFWWYGADQDSGDDAAFDAMFRQTLIDMYKTLGEAVPENLYVPIVSAKSPPPQQLLTGNITPVIDGLGEGPEWSKAAAYRRQGGAMAAGQILTAFFMGNDKKNLYLRLDAARPWKEIGDGGAALYIGVPSAEKTDPFPRFGDEMEPKVTLGYGAAYQVLVTWRKGHPQATIQPALGGAKWGKETPIKAGLHGNTIEVAVPFAALGDLEAGDKLKLRATVLSMSGRRVKDMMPTDGPATLVMPEVGTVTPIISLDDPVGDDHGPGSYVYPTDGVFKKGVFDLTKFSVGEDSRGNLVFTFFIRGPIENVWNSPNGLSVQALDVYIDVDHKPGSGRRMLLPGRNAAVSAKNAWDYAVWAEGWTPGVFKVDAKGNPQKMDVPLKVLVNAAAHKVTLRVSRSAFGSGDPAKWGYAAAVLSQDGFPAPGVWRVRDIEKSAQQWRFGGAPADSNHTRIIDLAWSKGASPTQEEILGRYKPSQEKDMDKLSPDDFAQLPMLRK